MTVNTFDAPPRSPISFGAVKVVLNHFGVTPEIDDGALALSLRLIFPLDRDLSARVRSGATSLTDRATSDEQIRFFQRRRADRSFIRIAERVVAKHGNVSITIGNASALDPASRRFFELAAAVGGWRIAYREDRLGAVDAQASDAERRLLADLDPRRLSEHVDDVVTAAFEYVNAGDAWTAANIGRTVVSVEQSARVWNLLALAFAMLNQTEDAEFYYRKWADSGNPLDAVRAKYGQSMLYARHHPDGLRDLDRCAQLLDEAYSLIQKLPAGVRNEDFVVFEEVFNRNGYALVQFRRGKAGDALEELERGIARLTLTSEKVAIHRSVLIYNLAQCHKQLGHLDQAIAAYGHLLSVDPHMPEYRLEAAKCYAAAGRVERAVSACKAALTLDDTMAAGWALLGLYLHHAGSQMEAARACERALHFEPRRFSYALDAAYNWLGVDRLTEAETALQRVDEDSLSFAEWERYASLRAELYVRRGDTRRAISALRSALSKFPDSENLQLNIDLLTRA